MRVFWHFCHFLSNSAIFLLFFTQNICCTIFTQSLKIMIVSFIKKKKPKPLKIIWVFDIMWVFLMPFHNFKRVISIHGYIGCFLYVQHEKSMYLETSHKLFACFSKKKKNYKIIIFSYNISHKLNKIVVLKKSAVFTQNFYECSDRLFLTIFKYIFIYIYIQYIKSIFLPYLKNGPSF